MKKAFISGTMNPRIVEEVQKLLSVIDYEGFSICLPEKEDPLEAKKERIKMLLDCDVLVTRDDISGPYWQIFKIELETAEYLNIPVIIFGRVENPANNNDRLNDLVSMKVLEYLIKDGDDQNAENNQ